MPSDSPHLLHEWTLSSGDRIGVRRFDIADEITRLIRETSGPVLQVGSRAEVLDRTARWRTLFPNETFVGLDIEQGPNVDIIGDITKKPDLIRKASGVKQFGFIICAHVLEHVRKPWEAAKNLQYLLKPGGHLFITVPWVQGFHEFPDDFWRMSFAGVRELFDRMEFDQEFYSGAAEDVGYQLFLNGEVNHSVETCRIERNLFQIEPGDLPPEDMFEDYPGQKLALSNLYMPACSVNLFGRKV